MSGISLPKSYFISIFCEALLHGAYTVLTGGALYLLLRKRREQRLQRTNLAMIALTLLMYFMGTIHVALALRVDLIAFFDQHAIEGGVTIFDDQGDRLVWLQIMIELLNCLMGDAIVAWRTWVLWGRDNRVLIFPTLCILGCVVSGTGMVVALSKSPPGQDIFSGAIVVWFSGFGALGCVANIYAVILMSWKALAHARNMKKMNYPAAAGRYSSALLLIIESGLVYCVAAIITSVLFVVDNNGVYIIADMLSDLTGIYPTIIIVLVCLKITYADEVTRAETFARQTTDGSGGAKPRWGNTTLSWRVAGNPGVTTTTGVTSTMSGTGSGLDSVSGGGDSSTAATRSYEMKPVGLGLEGTGAEPRTVAWPRVGQNGGGMGGAKGDMRLRYDPTYSGIGVDSVLAAGEECSLEDLEEERKLSGPEDGIARAV